MNPDPPREAAFELTAPATGQRFRVTVTETDGWASQLDQELAGLTRTTGERA